MEGWLLLLLLPMMGCHDRPPLTLVRTRTWAAVVEEIAEKEKQREALEGRLEQLQAELDRAREEIASSAATAKVRVFSRFWRSRDGWDLCVSRRLSANLFCRLFIDS